MFIHTILACQLNKIMLSCEETGVKDKLTQHSPVTPATPSHEQCLRLRCKKQTQAVCGRYRDDTINSCHISIFIINPERCSVSRLSVFIAETYTSASYCDYIKLPQSGAGLNNSSSLEPRSRRKKNVKFIITLKWDTPQFYSNSVQCALTFQSLISFPHHNIPRMKMPIAFF